MKKMTIASMFVCASFLALGTLSVGCAGGEGEGEGEGEGDDTGEGEGEEGEGDAPECDGQDDSTCYENDTLCDATGTCVDPNEVTGDCDDAGSFGFDAGGPIIYDADAPEDLGADDATGCAHVMAILVSVYSDVGFGTGADAYANVRNLDGGTAGDTYDIPDVDDSAAPDYFVNVYQCSDDGSLAGTAIGIVDNDGNEGNAYCF